MESRILAMAAVTIRGIVIKVCARPFVELSDLLLGAAAVMILGTQGVNPT